MKKLTVALLIALSSQASAADLIVGMACRHLNDNDHKYLNEVNPSVGIEVNDFQAVYVSKNSWGHKSLYATYTPDYVANDYITISAQIGFATGYKCSNHMTMENGALYRPAGCNDAGIMLLAATTIDYSPFANDFAVSLSVNPVVAMFSLKYKL